ncbi:MAG: fused MFS/spermidine synthase, partial [Candidatus Omnitrophota bacterium]
AWLFWGAVGSWGLGRFADRLKNQRLVFALSQIILAFILPAVALGARNIKAILGIMPGEIIGFLPMIGFSFILLSLPCVILGFLFTLACRMYPVVKKEYGASRIGGVYWTESLGAVCGGGIISFFFIRYLDAFYIMLGLSGLNLLCAYLLQRGITGAKSALAAKWLSLTLIAGLLVLLFSGTAKQWKESSIKRQWRGFELLAAGDSIYSNLAVARRAEQYSFFSNGLYLFTVPDIAASEEAAHFALLQTKHPRRMLLNGGGIAGIADEALKYPLDRLDYVELDAQILRMGKKFLPAENTAFLSDPRVHILHQDGRLFIKRAPGQSGFVPYDCIIVYLGNPYTAQINRFYTKEFFAEVKNCLAPDGVFSFSLGAAENFLNKEQKQLLSSVYRTLRSVFGEVRIIPGDTAYFLAAVSNGVLTCDARELERRLSERHIQTKFVREYYLFSQLSPDRMAYLAKSIQDKKAGLNSDFRPVSYYYDMALWGVLCSRLSGGNVLAWFNEQKLWLLFGLIYLFILMWGFFRRRMPGQKASAALLAVAATGFTELGFQVIILLAFQIIYGYVYYKLGVLLSFFMAGLVLGSRLMTQRLRRPLDEYAWLIKTQTAIVVYPLILPVLFYALRAVSAVKFMGWAGSNVIFPALPVIAGFIGGIQFPLVSKIVLKNTSTVGRTAGKTYGMDLLGSCIGALAVSAFLVPILGITQTCLAVALLNLVVWVVLAVGKGR